MLDPTGATIGTATAAAAGQDALIQATATTGTTTGTYQIVVGGAGSTSGNYTVQVTLNAALDAASYLVGASNGTLATAQPLDGSFQSLSPRPARRAGRCWAPTRPVRTPWNNYYSVNLSAGDVDHGGPGESVRLGHGDLPIESRGGCLGQWRDGTDQPQSR